MCIRDRNGRDKKSDRTRILKGLDKRFDGFVLSYILGYARVRNIADIQVVVSREASKYFKRIKDDF